jgi:hypothetical protein
MRHHSLGVLKMCGLDVITMSILFDTRFDRHKSVLSEAGAENESGCLIKSAYGNRLMHVCDMVSKIVLAAS